MCLPFEDFWSTCNHCSEVNGRADPGVTLGIYTRFRDEEIDNARAAIMDSLHGKSDYLMF
jgi:hypothetical protein